MNASQMTPQQALQVLSEAVEHETLKLSRREHCLIAAAVKILGDFIEPEKKAEPQPNGEK